jgi:hypothetical protein
VDPVPVAEVVVLRVAGAEERARRRAVARDPGLVEVGGAAGRRDGHWTRPAQAAVRRARELDVELAAAVVLPGDVEGVGVGGVALDAREVVRADVGAGDALLGAAAEVAQRLADDHVVADLRR